MGRASDWTRVKQNDIRRQVIRDERDQRLHDAEYLPHPDDPPPVNWALERWRARMAENTGWLSNPRLRHRALGPGEAASGPPVAVR